MTVDIDWEKVLRKWLNNGVPYSWYSPEDLRDMRDAAEAAMLKWLKQKMDSDGALVIGDLRIYVREYHVLVFLAEGEMHIVPSIGPLI